MNIIGPIFLEEKLTARKLFFTILGFIGIVIVFAGASDLGGGIHYLGMGAMLIQNLLGITAKIIFKKEVNKYTAIELVFHQSFLAILVAIGIVIFVALHSGLPFASLPQLGMGLLYGILAGLVGYGLYFSGTKTVDLGVASTIGYLEVLVAVCIGVVIFGDTLTLNIVLGGGLILFSGWGITRK